LFVLETHIKQGSKVKKTVNIGTDCGSLVVVNHDQASLARDIQIIRLIEDAQAMFVMHPPEEVEWIKRQEQMIANAKSLETEKPTLGGHKCQHRRVISQDLTAWPTAAIWSSDIPSCPKWVNVTCERQASMPSKKGNEQQSFTPNHQMLHCKI